MSDDIFKEVPADDHETDHTVAPKPEAAAPKAGGFEFKPVYFVIIGAIAAVIWIFFPDLFSGSKKPTTAAAVAPAANSTVLSPTDAMRDASQQQDAAHAQLDPQLPLGGVANNPVTGAITTGSTGQLMQDAAAAAPSTVTPAAAVNASPYTPEQVAQINNSMQAINADITKAKASGDMVGQRDAYQAAYNLSLNQQSILTNRINVLSRQVQDLQTQQTQLRSGLLTAHSKTKKADTGFEREPKPTVRNYKGSSVPGFGINTVYNDTAWIEAGNETFSVKAGDRLPGGIKVLNIDANSRVVITSNGLIR